MPDISFNTNAGQTIAREMLIVYLNTGTAASPVWSAVGKRVEDSSTEIDWDTETIRDILGATYGTMKKPTVKQTFDPCDLDSDDARPGRAGHAAGALLCRHRGDALCRALCLVHDRGHRSRRQRRRQPGHAPDHHLRRHPHHRHGFERRHNRRSDLHAGLSRRPA